MKKILFIANSDRHILLCHIPYLKMFKENGYTVHVATNTNNKIDYCDKKIKLSLTRKPFSLNNIKSIFEIRRLVKCENYDIISCHTPMGGFLGRVSVINQKLNTKVFYTAHGFHFYKGSKLINWLIYYPIELILSKYTTCLFTMNMEDYQLASSKFSCDTYKINGIGYDDTRLEVKTNSLNLKKKLGIKDEFVVTYIAEISKRKNQINLVKKLNKIDLEKENIKVLLIGDSIIKNFSKYIKNKNIIYIDFQSAVASYLNISDLVISPSNQEGLPLNIMEAMHMNKMVIATNIRGNKDLIVNNQNGILVNSLDELIKEMLNYKNNNSKYKINNKMDKYKLENVIVDIKNVYNKYLESRLK